MLAKGCRIEEKTAGEITKTVVWGRQEPGFGSASDLTPPRPGPIRQ